MGNTTLAGQYASVWNYELQKPGTPRLHNWLIGYTDGWNSYDYSCTVPAKDWEMWKPVFVRELSSATAGYLE